MARGVDCAPADAAATDYHRQLASSKVEQVDVRPRSVDWRNRWGRAWLATIQNQNPCNNCWAFAATALVETMVHIQHGVWSKRSEGDLRDGWGGVEENWSKRDGVGPCAHGAGLQDAIDYIVRKGIADPDCYPWSAMDQTYAPTADRESRTTRIGDVQSLTDIEQQKDWIDTIGPLTASLDVYADFQTVRTWDIYYKAPYAELFGRGRIGGHEVLVVDDDDDAGCWLIRNSWGAGWGAGGYGRIGYGECDIDDYVKYGVRETSPEPWTRRNLHSGNVLESESGKAHRNYEMVRAGPPRARHAWRAGGENGDFGWRTGSFLENPFDIAAGAGCIGHPTLIQSTSQRHVEAVYWEISGRLRHWWRGDDGTTWHDADRFGPSDTAGHPASSRATTVRRELRGGGAHRRPQAEPLVLRAGNRLVGRRRPFR